MPPAPPAAQIKAPRDRLLRLLWADVVMTGVLLAAVLGFGGYYLLRTLPPMGPTKHAEVKVVSHSQATLAVMTSAEANDRVQLDNPGVSKTWTVNVPFGTSVVVMIQAATSGGPANDAECSVTVDGAVVSTRADSANTTTCTWTNQ